MILNQWLMKKFKNVIIKNGISEVERSNIASEFSKQR